jgi:hypothetical protein
MSIPPAGNLLSMALFGILLACVIGLVAFVWIKLGSRPKGHVFRGIKVRVNAGLPKGRIVLTDRAWQPLGETRPDQFEMIALPPGCAAAWLSPADFAAFATRRTEATRVLYGQRLRA